VLAELSSSGTAKSSCTPWQHMRECRYSFTHSSSRRWMKVNGLLHAHADLPLGKSHNPANRRLGIPWSPSERFGEGIIYLCPKPKHDFCRRSPRRLVSVPTVLSWLVTPHWSNDSFPQVLWHSAICRLQRWGYERWIFVIHC